MSADPICLGCAEEITWNFAERRWESTSDDSPTCMRGPNAGKPHTTKLPGSR